MSAIQADTQLLPGLPETSSGSGQEEILHCSRESTILPLQVEFFYLTNAYLEPRKINLPGGDIRRCRLGQKLGKGGKEKKYK
jgi:hypothetical protein